MSTAIFVKTQEREKASAEQKVARDNVRFASLSLVAFDFIPRRMLRLSRDPASSCLAIYFSHPMISIVVLPTGWMDIYFFLSSGLMTMSFIHEFSTPFQFHGIYTAANLFPSEMYTTFINRLVYIVIFGRANGALAVVVVFVTR